MDRYMRMAKSIVRLAKSLVAGDFDCTIDAGGDGARCGGDFDCVITAGDFDDDEVDERPEYSLEDIVRGAIDDLADISRPFDAHPFGSGVAGKISSRGTFYDGKGRRYFSILICSQMKGGRPCVEISMDLIVNKRSVYGDTSHFMLHSDFADDLEKLANKPYWWYCGDFVGMDEAARGLRRIFDKTVQKLKSIVPDIAGKIGGHAEAGLDG